jgi:hypothetical protein
MIQTTPTITVLCASRSTAYQGHQAVRIFRRSDDANRANSKGPFIAHPPCRVWSRARALCTLSALQALHEMFLGIFCARQVYRAGGILEQPHASKLIQLLKADANLRRLHPLGPHFLNLDQHDFGHITHKPTTLVIVGIRRCQLPPPQLCFTPPAKRTLMQCTPGQRNATPPNLAQFLLTIARQCQPAWLTINPLACSAS